MLDEERNDMLLFDVLRVVNILVLIKLAYHSGPISSRKNWLLNYSVILGALAVFVGLLVLCSKKQI
jgi:hypothetical protein